jgi:hypothetical protein
LVRELKRRLYELREHYRDDGTVVEFPQAAQNQQATKRKKAA